MVLMLQAMEPKALARRTNGLRNSLLMNRMAYAGTQTRNTKKWNKIGKGQL